MVPVKLPRPLQENKVYTWALINRRTPKKYESAFVVLDKRYEEAVEVCLREIDEIGPREEVPILQAAVLQQWSDKYPKEVDFYWLSRQILSAPEYDDDVLTEEYKKYKEQLLRLCKAHERKEEKR